MKEKEEAIGHLICEPVYLCLCPICNAHVTQTSANNSSQTRNCPVCGEINTFIMVKLQQKEML